VIVSLLEVGILFFREQVDKITKSVAVDRSRKARKEAADSSATLA